MAHAGLQASRHLLQDKIACRMTAAIVDRLEFIQIDIHDRQAASLTLGVCQALVHPVEEQQTIGQVGQQVVVGQMGDPLMGLFLHRDIQFDRHVVTDDAEAVANGGDMSLLPVDFPGFTAVDQFALPGFPLRQIAPHLHEYGWIGQSGI